MSMRNFARQIFIENVRNTRFDLKLNVADKKTSVQHDQASKKQLLIDVSVIIDHDAKTGIQRVVRAITLNLLSTVLDDYVVKLICADINKTYCYVINEVPALHSNALKMVKTKKLVTVESGDVFLGLDLAAHIVPCHRQTLRAWKKQGVSINFIVYDLLPVQYPKWFKRKTNQNFLLWLRELAIISDRLICISESVKKGLLEWINDKYVLTEKDIIIRTFQLGSDIADSFPSTGIAPKEQDLLHRLEHDDVLLMVGTLEPRKGHADIIEAVERLWEGGSTIKLVLLGKAGWKTGALQKLIECHSELNKRLFWLSNASDECLSAFYKISSGVIVASLAEGYGLPIVEALRHHKAVLARDIPVFREVGNSAISYFDGTTAEDISLSIFEWMAAIKAGQISNELIDFKTWQMSANELLNQLDINTCQPHIQKFASNLVSEDPEASISPIFMRSLSDWIVWGSELLKSKEGLDSINSPLTSKDSIVICDSKTTSEIKPSLENKTDVGRVIPQLSMDRTEISACNNKCPYLDAADPSTYMSLLQADFICSAYLSFFGRAPDAAGHSYYSKRLSNGFSRIEVLTQLSLSEEKSNLSPEQIQWLKATHRILKNARIPIIGWLYEFIAMRTRVQLNELLLPDNEEFLAVAYRELLHRDVDAVGKKHYSQMLLDGADKEDVLVDIYKSAERKVNKKEIAGLKLLGLWLSFRKWPLIRMSIGFIDLPERMRLNAIFQNKVLGRLDSNFNELMLTNQKIVLESQTLKHNLEASMSEARQLRELLFNLDAKVMNVSSNLYNQNVAQKQALAEHAKAVQSECAAAFSFLETAVNKLMSWQAEIRELIASMSNENTSNVQDINQAISRADNMQHLIVERQIKISENLLQSFTEKFQTLGHLKLQSIHNFDLAVQKLSQQMSSANSLVELLATKKQSEQDRVFYTQEIKNAKLEVVSLLGKASLALEMDRNKTTIDLLESISKSLNDAKTETIERILAAEHDQLERLETYSLISAKRVAINCGDGSMMIRSAVGYVLCADTDFALIASLTEAGELEPGTRILIEKYLRVQDTYIDVGANIGMHVIAAARAVGHDGKVLAYEPHPITANFLRQSTWLNGLTSVVSVVEAAVGDAASIGRLYIGKTSGHHSLYSLSNNEGAEEKFVEVQVVTLDALSENIGNATLLKIDAEGAELEVIRGAKNLLSNNTNLCLIVEYGLDHLVKRGSNTAAWLSEFTSKGFEWMAIEANTGSLFKIDIEKLIEIGAINLFFYHPGSDTSARVLLSDS